MDSINEEQVTINQTVNNIRNFNIFLLVISRLITSLSGMIFSFAISLYILDITGSALAFSIVLGTSLLPGVIVNTFAGVFVDKNNKKYIMVLCDFLSGLITLLLLLLFSIHPKNIIIFIVYSIISSIIQAFFSLALNSSIPDLVSKDNTAKVNSIIQAIVSFSNVVGPIIGAIAYKIIDLQLLFSINAFALMSAGFLKLFLVYKHVKINDKNKKSYFEDLKFVFQYLNGFRVLAFFFIFAAIINLLYIPLTFVVVRYISYQVLKVSELQVSFIQAAGAIGVIIAALFISLKKSLNNYLIKKFMILFQIQSVLIILWIFPGFSIFQDEGKWMITIIFSILLVLYGLLNTFQNIPVITYFQLNVPENLRARLFGFFMSAVFITTPIGMWMFGICLHFFNWTFVIITSGIIMLILGFIAARNKYFKEFIHNANFNN